MRGSRASLPPVRREPRAGESRLRSHWQRLGGATASPAGAKLTLPSHPSWGATPHHAAGGFPVLTQVKLSLTESSVLPAVNSVNFTSPRR